MPKKKMRVRPDQEYDKDSAAENRLVGKRKPKTTKGHAGMVTKPKKAKPVK